MHTRHIQTYFILLNILVTLSQHTPREQHQQIASIIVSATAMPSDTTTTTHVLRDFTNVTATTTTTAAEAVARTTSASAFVDEVLPHNDSVATTTMLHAKAIDSNGNSNNNSEDFAQLIERKLQEEHKAALASASSTVNAAAAPDRLLSRKRRYLIFPEGSSFQLVYDGIYGVADYTNYLILGITVALAWELPSKPQGDVIEEIATRLREPANDLRRNDTESRIIYVETKAHSTQTTKQQTLQPAKSLQPNYINIMTLTNPAARKSDDSKYYYAKATARLPPAFQAPMHPKYYYYKGTKKYDYNNKKTHMFRRPTDSYYRTQATRRPVGGYYRQQPNDWRRKDQHYYGGGNKNKLHKSSNKNNNLRTLKVHPFNKWTPQPQQRASSIYNNRPQAQNGSNQYPWWNLGSRLSHSLRRKPIPSRRIDSGTSSQPMHQRQQNQQQGTAKQQKPKQAQQKQKQAASGFYQQPPAAARKHRIYPVFGKRSIADEPATAQTAAAMHINNKNKNNSSSNKTSHGRNHSEAQESTPHRRYRRSGIVGNELSRMERIHVRHHRRTRQTLYEKIEKYLDKLEIPNSHHCILRALCETGQKSNERAPGTFVGELMRALFTIPEALDEDVMENRIHYKDKRYDAANAFQGSCAEEYALCRQSLWKSQFIQ
ncbi:uncharacterized protein LOC105232974 [Bactrocera dorsalis]|uniref:Uncharacterized protein LOC105232974 n=1 Tax=Bactrocera dorsalis TaxID=27457 RepID=A0A8N4L4L9_BACDO|nr:uncharacterized protein LOC105232974 [Bactrocera dorsalis]